MHLVRALELLCYFTVILCQDAHVIPLGPGTNLPAGVSAPMDQREGSAGKDVTVKSDVLS